jgi:hypothetical protein
MEAEQVLKKDIYNEMCVLAKRNYTQMEQELGYFERLYSKEFRQNEGDKNLTYEIIQNLKRNIEHEKSEYRRFKTLSFGC